VEARKIRMNHLILMAVVTPILVLMAPPYSVFAYDDPKHCFGYNTCFNIGYQDGYTDKQNGASPSYACVGHSHAWCSGYNDGFRAGNGGSNIYIGPSTGQSASINIRGNDDKVSINQQTNNQVEDNGFSSSHGKSIGVLPNCVILCLNSEIRLK
jgi:hypothetical protein